MILLWNGYAQRVEKWTANEETARLCAEEFAVVELDVIYFFAEEGTLV